MIKFFGDFLGFCFCFLADKGFQLFLVGGWFTVDIKDGGFGSLLCEVGGGEFLEFKRDFVLMLLFKKVLP